MTTRIMSRSAIMAGVAAVAFAAAPAFAQTYLNANLEPIDAPAPIAEQFGNQMHWGLHYAGINPWLVDELPAVVRFETYGYVYEEYFITGTIGEETYTTRFTVLRPENVANFSGMALIETQHAGAGIFQTMSYTRAGGMAAGHVYIGVTNTNAQLGGGTHLASINAPRYAGLRISEANNTPAAIQDGIIAQVAGLLRTNNPVGDEWVPEWVVMTGASATAGTASNYMIRASGNTAEAYRLPDGRFPVDAMYIWDNTGYNDNNNMGESIRANHLDGPLATIPTIVMATQVEWRTNSAAVNANRSPDSDLYRLYQVPGMPHIGTRYLSDAFQCSIEPWSRFMTEALVYVGVDRMYNWLANGEDPGFARVEFDDESWVRDEHGNAVGGLRSPQVDVPTVTFQFPNAGGVGGPVCGLSGFDEEFDAEKLAELYPGGQADYARQMWARTLELVAQGWFPAEYIWDVQAEIATFGQTWVNPTYRR